MAVPILEVRALGKEYGTTRALDDVHFAVNEGEMFGLLGPNGAGKTTLLSIISGLLRASRGEVLIAGNTFAQTPDQTKRLLGLVPQELAIYNELTASENLQFFGELYGLRGKDLRQRIHETLEAVGLAAQSRQRVSTFSGGMKRRLNLGVGMIHHPRLLLLDEPTVGVDPQSRNHIFEEVRRLNANGVTVVYTSHYMEEVQALCTRVGIIDHGHLVQCDTLPNLLSLLGGQLRVRLAHPVPELTKRLQQIPNIHVDDANKHEVLLECPDVQAVLVRLVGLIAELKVEMTGIDVQEPNLEGVFLHLTGKALRD